MTKLWGGVLAVTGFIACPCHLPLTLPLLLGVLGGTSAGSFIAANTGLLYGLATGYFVLGLGVGLFLLNRRRGQGIACDLPETTAASAAQGGSKMANVTEFQLTLHDNAMHCNGCESTVERVVKRLPGVIEVKADYKTQKVLLNLDQDQTPLDEVKRKLEAAGYPVG